MNKIKRLSQDVIAKIAAGEVIERPVYAVKELVENSLDAAATIIKVAIEQGGLQKIIVTDNGIGMSAEDLRLAVERHTTSKIFSAEELYSVRSFGFRGEALASIAAISKLRIQSKLKKEDIGTKIEVVNNKIISEEPVGMPSGTSVEIEELFYSLPARQKFLKSKQTEFRFITQLISLYSLAYPQVRFILQHNKKMIIDVLPSEKINERVENIVGNSSMSYFLPVLFENNVFKLHGFIAKPQLSTHSRSRQIFFVNNRVVQNQVLVQSIRTAYGTLLEVGTFPVFILFLELPVEHIDVNVHPRKEEVAFHQEEQIISFIEEGIRDVLGRNNLTYVDKRWSKENTEREEKLFSVREGTTGTYAANILKKDFIAQSNNFLQLHNLFIVLQTSSGVLLIDQHAAHERVLFEQFLSSLKNKIRENRTYALQHNIELKLSFTQSELLKEFKGILQNFGFSFLEKKDSVFICEKVPLLFKDKNILEFLSSLLDDLEESGTTQSIDMRTHRMLTFLACRSAVKAGQALSQKEMKNLLKQLLNSDNFYTCPHGRPTMYEIPLKDLNNFFKRS